VEAGADLKLTNKDGTSALHYLVRHSSPKKEYREALTFLLDSGAYINMQNKHGETPLHNAILRGNREVVVLLLSKGADIQITNKHGETVLHYAVLSQKKDVVEMLLDLGVDPRGGSGVNGTAIEVARATGQTEILEMLERKTTELCTPVVEYSTNDFISGVASTSDLKVKMLRKKHSWEIDFNELNLGRRIGKGAFGAVYMAEWRGTTVAMKKIHSNSMSKKESDTFFKEIHTISKLRHPNIILFLGACLKEPNICFITEFARKGDLYGVLQREKDLPLKTKMHMACDAARGLLYLHMCSPPVVHRDLKSLNLLVDELYNVKLTDFGISKSLQNNLETFNSKMGTLNWLAPEVLDCKPYSPAADVYSFGIILWEIATQQIPFKGMHNFQILSAVAKGQGLPVPEGIDPDYAALMRSMWQVEPKERPGMKEVLERLVEIERRVEAAESLPKASPVPSPARSPAQESNNASASQLSASDSVLTQLKSEVVDDTPQDAPTGPSKLSSASRTKKKLATNLMTAPANSTPSQWKTLSSSTPALTSPKQDKHKSDEKKKTKKEKSPKKDE
jgi:serine/threonine protein kinase